MNFRALLAATAAALVGSVSATTCTSTQQTAAYVALVSILSDTSFSQCSTDSGYSMLTATALPTTAQYKLMCTSMACKAMIAKIVTLNPPDCELTVPTSGLVLNVYSYANGFSATCTSLSSSRRPAAIPDAIHSARSSRRYFRQRHEGRFSCPFCNLICQPQSTTSHPPLNTKMNFRALLAATAAALVGSVSATTCTSTQQTAAYVALVSILSDTSFSQCSTDSGYSMLTATALPTTAQYKLMCTSTACKAMIAKIVTLNPPDCELTVPTSGLVLNVYTYANGFSATCTSLSS
ncbi:hypothetical protein BBJ29_010024 [Phytophthora kernoviae]|uniref:Elicitin n=1 Tax=Phytophthora kernoviae TaxID=325452 RepID=A0A3F2RAU8_9STRA|nr:hypothetical protein BBP00_00010040 [Phytophthora kernoviae]RLN54438.1 hypothetical protein BBJ29_010024 [Phytophthora kernoviae]